MKKPLVSIIVLNWNNNQDLEVCLNSLTKQTYLNYEVIVVDNASTDDSVELVKKKFLNFRLIENKENYGFAKGNNIGINQANGKYVITLNNDTKVDSKWIEEFVKVGEDHPEVGSLSCKMLYGILFSFIYAHTCFSFHSIIGLTLNKLNL